MINKNSFCEFGKNVVQIEAQAIQSLASRIDENFTKACQLMLDCKGRIIILGMGKSGHIGNKIAATFASTGTPSFFVHPGEANHGDLGMITPEDVILAISNSGTTTELTNILPLIKRFKTPLITLTGRPNSTLAQAANVNLDVSVSQEACPLGLAPTASTTATLVMGDALAIALLEARGFTADDFALYHPGGSLGRRLLLKIDELMHTGDAIPCVTEKCSISKALIEVSEKRLGITTIVNSQQELLGIFTDGDLRRMLDQEIDLKNTSIQSVMTKNCLTIAPNTLAVEALQIMQNHKITALIVTNETQKPLGVLHMHDLLQAGII